MPGACAAHAWLCDPRLVAAFVLAVQSSNVNVWIGALLVGLVVGVSGHIVRSRTLIVTGILIIGLVSAYFAFVLQPMGG